MHDDIVLSSLVETVSTERGFTTTSFMLGGETHAAAIVAAVASAYEEAHPFDQSQLADLDGKPVTLLRIGRSEFGVTAIRVQQGRLFRDGTSILPKGKQRHGFKLDPDTVLDLRAGYNQDGVLREQVAAIRARFPETQALTADRLRELPARSDECSLAVFGTWRGPDGDVPGAVWLIHSYLAEDDIVEGVLLVGGYGESEHGSIYGEQLLRMGGEIIGFAPISFADAIALCDVDIDAALPIVLGRAALSSPECEKVAAVSEKSQAIGEFLEWLSEGGTRRMRWEQTTDLRTCPEVRCSNGKLRKLTGDIDCFHCDGTGVVEVTVGAWMPDRRSVQQLLAEFFDIDLNKVEDEKEAILTELRERAHDGGS